MVKGDGPVPARIMLVGEAPGAEEERLGRPFVGASGYELNRMLAEAGIARGECYVTNVCRVRPPNNDIQAFFAKAKKDRTPNHTEVAGRWVTREILEGLNLLQTEIATVQPNIIIALGNTPLWALAGLNGITKWRGSLLYTNGTFSPRTQVLPTIHPASVLREWKQRAIVVADLRRAARYRTAAYPDPNWQFEVRPSYERTIQVLDQLFIRAMHRGGLELSFDLETRSGHIACAGLAWSRHEAICIPFMSIERAEGYWDLDQEAEIIYRLRGLLTHPAIRVIGQNLLYDAQYTWKHWRFVPRVAQDTMISQHAAFSDLPKSLGFLGSMYCEYFVYWKDEGKDWDKKTGEDQLWRYNCQDCVYTLEAAHALRQTVDTLKLDQVHGFQQSMFWPVLQAMIRGVRVDTRRRSQLILEVQEAVAQREQFLIDVLGHPINPESPKQMHALFYDDLRLPVQMTRATKQQAAKPTLNDEALQRLAKLQPLVRPLVNAICDIRTLNKFLSNFLCRPLSEDGRMRCSYNIGGSESGKSAPKTYRLSSSADAFGCGTNLQTIPSETSKSHDKAVARGGIPILGDPYLFPNIREIFIPDSGNTFFDMDLERADLFVVCYEADDALLKAAMRLGTDIHLLNAYALAGKDPPPLDELVKTHPRYEAHYEAKKHERQFAKVFVHGTNYGGKSRTMAAHCGRTVAEVDRAQKRWFAAHPGILQWHRRVENQITARRVVENKFGYQWRIFDRPDSILPEAIAWIPQSTVSIVINRIWMALFETVPEIQVLLQLHDSICGQMPTDRVQQLLPQLKEAAQVTVPYDDPLVIPVNVKLSERSWGHCA